MLWFVAYRLNSMFTKTRTFLEEIIGQSHQTLIDLSLILIIAIASVSAYYVTKYFLKLIEKIVIKSPSRWDDDLIDPAFTKAVSQLAPALAVNWLLPGFFGADTDSYGWIRTLTSIYILCTVVYIVVIFIDNLYNSFTKRENLKAYAIKGIFQMFKLIAIGIGAIWGVSILIGKSPLVILTALGASAAVLMLVFKDTILGLVASIQLSANKMLNRGDWIIAEKHGANGTVEDVSLTTIKVKNWDNSITTIPPYSLVSESFKNYQPMVGSGGRKVERAIIIDFNSVAFLPPEKMAQLEKSGYLSNLPLNEQASTVNLHILRKYLEHFIANDSRVNTSMTHMVRQLEPQPYGIPLQLYFFLKNTEWTKFESTQSDIFDHIYAIVREFNLSIYQAPAASDFSSLKSQKPQP